MCGRPAPKAIRIPISCVRCSTVGHQTVDADGCEQHRNCRKQVQKQHGEALAGDALGDDLLHRPLARHRQQPIESVKLALDRHAQAHRIEARADRPRQRDDRVGERGQPFRHLALRNVHDTDLGLTQSRFAHTADHPNDLARRVLELRAQALADGDHVPDGIFLRPVLSRHCIINYDDVRGVFAIGLAEGAAAQ
jgi:hypothetical protein